MTWINNIKKLNIDYNGIYNSLVIGTLFLDLYPNATTAYSVRKLKTSYNGSCMRIRRSNDNSETDIGWVNNYVDTASILSFCGANSGYVTTFYDQSGNANNAIQNTAVSQPLICLNGNLNLVNNLLSLYFDGSNDFLQFTSITLINQYKNLMVTKRQSLGFPSIPMGCASGTNAVFTAYTRSDDRVAFTTAAAATTNGAKINTGAANDTNLNLRSYYTEGNPSGATGNAYLNNVILSGLNNTTVTANPIAVTRLGFERSTYGFGNLSENILYITGSTINRNTVLANQSAYFGLGF